LSQNIISCTVHVYLLIYILTLICRNRNTS